jgi:DNA mismatch endonuclease (patch repair protein)
MQAIRSTDSKAEQLLAKSLWAKGYRYRKNDKRVFGKPDLTLRKYHLAIFVDSAFFHGRDWDIQKFRIQSNREFWWKKIEGNMARDKKVNEVLTEQNWKIIRVWDTDVLKNLAYCIQIIENETKIP